MQTVACHASHSEGGAFPRDDIADVTSVIYPTLLEDMGAIYIHRPIARQNLKSQAQQSISYIQEVYMEGWSMKTRMIIYQFCGSMHSVIVQEPITRFITTSLVSLIIDRGSH